MKTLKLIRFFILAIAFFWAGLVGASIETACGTTTWNLTAGQTINVGSITVSNDTENLYVKYKLDYAGATFGTVHLWAGSDLANLPKTQTGPNAGVPIPGQFPFQYNVNGGTEYTFAIPFTSLSIADVKACPLTLYVVAHAEVNINGNSETAFGGDQPGTGPRWWFYANYNVCCTIVPPPVVGTCNTAFAKGGYVFTTDKKSNPENLPSLNLSKNRWGWAINLTAYDQPITYNIYAGAGLNNTSKGVKVGTLTVNWDGAFATITYDLDDYVMKELHIYASDFKPTTVAPGQYGYTKYFDPPVDGHTATFNVADTNSDGIWIIAHALSCELVPQ
jgi:hypothetical protein